MPPGEEALRSLRAEKFLADKERQHLSGEDLLESRVVDPGDLMEDAPTVRAALGYKGNAGGDGN